MVLQSTYEGCNNDSYDERDNIRPGRKANVFLENHDKTKDKADDKHCNIPPPGCFLVVLGHVLVMPVIISTLFRALVCLLDIIAPKENTVHDQCTNLGVLADECERKL